MHESPFTEAKLIYDQVAFCTFDLNTLTKVKKILAVWAHRACNERLQ